ncbi:MAG TPA: hypothetical protein PKB13_05605 [Clostridia bacterium]|nr:hypothetical protein [Clostridia bacterium]
MMLQIGKGQSEFCGGKQDEEEQYDAQGLSNIFSGDDGGVSCTVYEGIGRGGFGHYHYLAYGRAA